MKNPPPQGKGEGRLYDSYIIYEKGVDYCALCLCQDCIKEEELNSGLLFLVHDGS